MFKERVRKSESLPPEVKIAFTNWVKEQPTKIDAADIIGIDRGTLDRILLCGSCKPSTAEKIRAILKTPVTV